MLTFPHAIRHLGLAFQSTSTVVPIYGMFIIGGSLLGVIFLSEPMHARKMLGITFAVISIFLIAR